MKKIALAAILAVASVAASADGVPGGGIVGLGGFVHGSQYNLNSVIGGSSGYTGASVDGHASMKRQGRSSVNSWAHSDTFFTSHTSVGCTKCDKDVSTTSWGNSNARGGGNLFLGPRDPAEFSYFAAGESGGNTGIARVRESEGGFGFGGFGLFGVPTVQ